MRLVETALPGVLIIEPAVFEDARGFFFETYHQAKLDQRGIAARFVQENHSKSIRGALRGLHYQLKHPQAKLCRVIHGEVLDVVVDIRRGSPTFARWIGTRLKAEDRRQIYIPTGFAHGFLVLSESADFIYKCSDFYFPADERGILWNDRELAIDWGIERPILSAKDRALPPLSRIPPDEFPSY